MSERRKFSSQFKLEAVKMLQERGRSVNEVAQALEVRPDMLRRWKSEFERHGEEAFPGSGRLKPDEDEVRQLRAELRKVREERDILKKALAIFSDRRR